MSEQTFAFRNKYGKVSDTHIILSTFGVGGFKAHCGTKAEPHKVKEMLEEGKGPCGRCLAKTGQPVPEKKTTPKKKKKSADPRHASGKCSFPSRTGLRVYDRHDKTTRQTVLVWYKDLTQFFPECTAPIKGRPERKWLFGIGDSFWVVEEDLERYFANNPQYGYTYSVETSPKGIRFLVLHQATEEPATSEA